jgi:hypothetical protein
MVVLGVAPNPFLEKSEPAVRDLLELVETKLAAAESVDSIPRDALLSDETSPETLVALPGTGVER